MKFYNNMYQNFMPLKYYAKWHKQINIEWFHLYEMSRIGKFLETENKLDMARHWGRNGELLEWYKFWKQMYNIVNIINAIELYLKVVKMADFVLYVLCHKF